MKQYKAVIFDVDGTLVDRRVAFYKFCEIMIERYSDEYPYEGTKQDLIDYMIKIDGNGYEDIECFIPRLSTLWKLPHTSEEFIEERNAIFGKLVTPFPKVHEVLQTLKEKYRLGIITNGYSSVQRDKLQTAGITDYFDAITVSDEEGCEKPDLRIFQLTCERLGVKPEETVYVGDYFQNDICGAMQAKIMPIWVTENTDEHKEYSGLYIRSLEEILKLL